jgi:hypothetical protein
MARDPGKLSDRPWSGGVEIAAADAMEGTCGVPELGYWC